MAKSLAEQIAVLSEEERAAVFEGYTEEMYANLQYDAEFWLRPEQQIEGDDWYITALIAGRGFGKTLTASQWIRKKAMENPGCRIAVGGRTVGDVRRVMVKGESGILAVHPESDRPEYKSSEATLYWPNGSIAELHSSESPDAARGPAYHFCVGDEFAAWKDDVDSSGATLYSNLIAATRLGERPQILLATTPKRTATMKDLMDRAKDPTEDIRIVTGSTLDNTSLSGHYVKSLVRQYGDSDLAKQEIEGKMLEDSEGIVFTNEMLENAEKLRYPGRLPLRFISVDPSVSATPENSDECGIMAIGATVERDLTQRKAFVLEDYSVRATPDIWAEEVVAAAKKHRTKFIVVEKNQGGDLLRLVLTAKDPTLKVFPVTATKGKLKRAEPVVIAMQQGRVGLTQFFPELRDQLLFFDPERTRDSPDRMDAFVWGIVAALVDPPEGLRVAGSKVTTGINRKIPQTRGSGKNRVHGSIRRRR